MSVKRYSGVTKLNYVPASTSQVYAINSLLTADGSGNYDPADAASTTIKGICLEAIGATDDRYTTAGKVMIDEINPDDVFIMTVSGTFTAAKIGTFLDLVDAVTVNADATAVDVVECVGYINSTTGLFKINANAATKGAVGSTA